MRAIVVKEFGDPEVMKVAEVPDPRPGPGEVAVKIGAAGVNPVETYVRSGNYARLPNLPYTPGSDAAGEVAALGDAVTDLKVGDRVYIYTRGPAGTYAEKAVVSRDGVWRLPDRLSFEQGAAISTPCATAYRALHEKGQGLPGEWLLVHGASGAVGSSLVQIGLAHGMRVIGTAGSEEGRALVKKLGAELVVDHKDPGHLDQALKHTGGHGMDVIVELLANVNLGKDLPALAQRGRVVVVGSRGSVEMTPRDLMNKEGRIEAMVLFSASPERIQSIHAGLAALLANGALTPVVGSSFKLADAPAAHRAVMGSSAHGKIVLTP